MILTISNFDTKNKSGYNINNIKKQILQKISNIFLHKLSGLHIVYNSLKVIKPVRDTTTKR